ncbi:MAG: hypothetical protein QM235_06865, partial [Pseudomonadota bacterium]|nr:hypothetical protein [Pseudomonadota bacterium]
MLCLRFINAQFDGFGLPQRIVIPEFDSRKNNNQLKWQVTDTLQACATTFSLFVMRRSLGGGLSP